jgi:hypothetical protein
MRATTLRTCDLLCIGGGLGGLAGAVRAHDLGLHAIILEKSSRFGGVAAYSGGAVWVPNNHLEREAGIDDSWDDACRYLDYLGGDGVDTPYDRELRNAFLYGAAEALEWYHREVGIPFQIIGLPDMYYPHVAGSKAAGRELEVAFSGLELKEWQSLLLRGPYHKAGLTHREMMGHGGQQAARTHLAALVAERQAIDYLTQGMGLAGAFGKAALTERKIALYLQARANQLLLEGGRVVGAVARIDGEDVAIRARRGVLLATGSYGNAPYAATMEGLPAIVEQAPPVLDGDALDLTDPTPAALVRSSQTFVTVGFRSATDTHPGTDVPVYFPVYESLARPHSLVVNASGRRFGDETFYGTFSEALRAFDPFAKKFRNYPCYLIMDDQFRRHSALGATDAWPIESLVRAPDLRLLASNLGIDKDALEATIARYNADVATGIDTQFQRGQMSFAAHVLGDAQYANPTLGALEEPPFWGVRLELLGAGIYSHGLQIDAQARVLTRRRQPVPGLFATGNAVAYTEVLYGYESGFANARNMTYGYLAAGSAASA